MRMQMRASSFPFQFVNHYCVITISVSNVVRRNLIAIVFRWRRNGRVSLNRLHHGNRNRYFWMANQYTIDVNSKWAIPIKLASKTKDFNRFDVLHLQRKQMMRYVPEWMESIPSENRNSNSTNSNDQWPIRTQDIAYKSSMPVYSFLRLFGVFPYIRKVPGQAEFKLFSKPMAYSVCFFILLLVCTNLCPHPKKKTHEPFHSVFFSISQCYVIYVGIHRIEVVQSLEGRFEESVIAYLFLVNILPILIVPMIWTETGKFTKVLNDWTDFEVCYVCVC